MDGNNLIIDYGENAGTDNVYIINQPSDTNKIEKIH
jgi:hypothetical protein